MLIRRVERENHVRTELLQVSFALSARAIRIDHATYGDEVAGFIFLNCRADLRDTADDLVARNDRVVRGHELAPFVAHGMQIRMADAAEQNFDLHVALRRIASRNRGRSQWRRLTGS